MILVLNWILDIGFDTKNTHLFHTMGREHRGSEPATLDWYLSISRKSDCLVKLASGISQLHLNIPVNEIRTLLDTNQTQTKEAVAITSLPVLRFPKI